MTDQELIELAASVVRPVECRGGMVGDVGCALLAESGSTYTGVCADIGSNVFCAEQNAIGSMITDGYSKIQKIVAVWKDEGGGVFVIAPCGNCRQFMLDIDQRNLDAKVILDADQSIALRELIPHYDSWKPQDV